MRLLRFNNIPYDHKKHDIQALSFPWPVCVGIPVGNLAAGRKFLFGVKQIIW